MNVVVHVTPPAAALAVGLLVGPIPPELDAWTPLLALGPPAEASARVERWVRLARAWNRPWVLDAAARRRLTAASEHLDLLDLGALHRLMPRTSTSGARRGWTFHGRLTGEDRLEVRTAQPSGPPRFGDGTIDLSLTPLPPDAYRVDSQAELQVAIRSDEVLGLFRRSLGWLAARARLVPPKRPRTFDAADAAVMSALRRAFPRYSAFVLRYIHVEDVLEPSRAGARLRLVARLDVEALAADCPALAASVARASDMLDGRARLEGASRDVLGVAQVRGEDKRGRAVLVLDPERWLRPRLDTRADVLVETLGTRIAVEGLTVRTRLGISPERLSVTSGIEAEPRLTVRTPAIVDALITSDLDTIVRRFFELLAGAADGRGAQVQTRLTNQEAAAVKVQGSVPVPDNGTVTFGLRVLRAIGWSDAHREERTWLVERGLDAFEADLRRFVEAAAAR